ncbi:DNA helicase II [Escherichia coli]
MADFAELAACPRAVARQAADPLKHYRDRFQNILVDEFQDTNGIQYAWLRMLAGDTGKVMIVGDDDQSIYGWRGAKIENIQRFLTDYQGAETIRLEQNYRSTANILKAANSVIANNAERLGKELWTEGAEGEPIPFYAAFNEVDEARFVVGRLKDWKEKGGLLADCAILYRSNAQSRVLEEALMQDAMPYRIYGGLRFFERQEIKDAMAYLRLINNRGDDASFERVVNTPTRGIGDRTLDVVRQTSRDRQLTLWQACRELLQEKALAGRAASALQRFMELIDALAQETADMPLHVQTDRVIKDSGLRTMYEQEKGEKGQTRIENLEELVTATRQFSYNEEDEDLMPLQAFLSHAALEAGEGQADTWQDAVQLMTLHSAKGLEFPQVFIVGMEEGMFPSQMSLDEGGRLEEERRLAYVGVTRAMQKLTLTYAETRRLYGKEVYHRPSRFIGELPEECVEEVRLRATVSRPVSHQRMGTPMVENDSGYKLGQRVRHAKFGEGTIVNMEGSGEHSRLQVAFQGQGIKWLVAAYARLESV